MGGKYVLGSRHQSGSGMKKQKAAVGEIRESVANAFPEFTFDENDGDKLNHHAAAGLIKKIIIIIKYKSVEKQKSPLFFF